MRKVTQNVVGVISLGVLAASWSIGQAAESGLVVGAPSTSKPTSSAEPSASTAPVESPSASASANASASAKPTPSPSKPAANNAAVTKKSDAITYVAEKRQGVMQVSVTKKGSAITAVDIISGGTEGGEYASVPGILAQAAIDAQGSNFGNISRATHTTEAFKKALESALAKF